MLVFGGVWLSAYALTENAKPRDKITMAAKRFTMSFLVKAPGPLPGAYSCALQQGDQRFGRSIRPVTGWK